MRNEVMVIICTIYVLHVIQVFFPFKLFAQVESIFVVAYATIIIKVSVFIENYIQS